MATPEDMKANAEFIKLADSVVEVGLCLLNHGRTGEISRRASPVFFFFSRKVFTFCFLFFHFESFSLFLFVSCLLYHFLKPCPLFLLSVLQVPAGKNSNNYANVGVICKIAQQQGVDAVWPGWGHASEKPELPDTLASMGIKFIGEREEDSDHPSGR